MDPNYKYGTAYQEGVLSYVGRTEYLTGRLPQARETLQKALAENKDNDVARIYLGLTLIRSGEREAGLKDVEAGMKGIHAWLDWVNEAFRFSFGQYWDPAHEIRKAIDSDLAMINGRRDWRPNLMVLATQGHLDFSRCATREHYGTSVAGRAMSGPRCTRRIRCALVK